MIEYLFRINDKLHKKELLSDGSIVVIPKRELTESEKEYIIKMMEK